jgi:hypothetical protein
MRSIAFQSFPVMPSCPERVQRVKRNPNLNSLGTFLAQERYKSKTKKLLDFLSRKSRELFQKSGINKKRKKGHKK